MKKTQLISLGTMYVDINCINFPFDKGLFVHRETTGDTYQLELGGSALNFAKLATQLDLQTTFIGKVGDDIMGKALLKLLKKNAINPAVIVDNTVQTNLAIHYIHKDGSSIMTSSGNANQSLTNQDIQGKLKQINTADFLYLGGCFKLKKLLPYLSTLAQTAKQKGIKVVLDHGRVNNNVTIEDISMIVQLIPYVDIYLPSIDEFLEVWDVTTVEKGVEKIQKHAQPIIVIKQGDLGAIGYRNNQSIKVPAYSIKAVNTVGAGDSFNAGFIRAMSEGKNFEQCLSFACATAAVKISSTGNVALETIKTIAKQNT